MSSYYRNAKVLEQAAERADFRIHLLHIGLTMNDAKFVSVLVSSLDIDLHQFFPGSPTFWSDILKGYTLSIFSVYNWEVNYIIGPQRLLFCFRRGVKLDRVLYMLRCCYKMRAKDN